MKKKEAKTNKRGICLAGVLIVLLIILISLVNAQTVTNTFIIKNATCARKNLNTECTSNVNNSDNIRQDIQSDLSNFGFVNGTFNTNLPASSSVTQILAIFEWQAGSSGKITEWYFYNSSSSSFSWSTCANSTTATGNVDQTDTCNLTSLANQINLNNLVLQNKLYPAANFKIDYFAINVTYIPDVVPPVITILSPQDINYSTSSIDFNLSLNENVSSCLFSLDNTANVSMTINSSLTGASYLKTELSTGSHSVIFSCNDTANNLNSSSVTFTVDNTPPLITVNSPQNTTYSTSSIFFNINLNEAGDLCKFTLNNWLTNYTMNKNTNTNFNYTNNSIADSSYTTKFSCNDSLGNINNTVQLTFSIDTIPPSISISEPTGTKSSKTNIPSSWTISEQNSNSCWYNLYRGTNPEITNTSINCTKTSAFFNVTLDNVEFTFNFYVNDSAGNSNSSSSTFTVFTSSTPPSTPPSSGGDGGGGSSTSFIQQSKLELSSISNMIIPPGKTEKMSLNVRNTGATFLNNCKLRGSGDFSSWIISSETKGLSVGEAYDFIFTINVPSGTKADSYPLTLNVECQEASKSLNFLVDIIEKKMEIRFIDIKRGNNNVKVIYSLEELSDINQDVTVQILLLGTNNERIGESTEKVTIEAKTKKQLETILNVSSSMKGIYNLLINANSDTASTFVQEEVVVSNPSIGGLAILFGENSTNMLLTAVSVIIFVAFTVFVIRRMIKYKNLNKVKKIDSNFIVSFHKRH